MAAGALPKENAGFDGCVACDVVEPKENAGFIALGSEPEVALASAPASFPKEKVGVVAFVASEEGFPKENAGLARSSAEGLTVLADSVLLFSLVFPKLNVGTATSLFTTSFCFSLSLLVVEPNWNKGFGVLLISAVFATCGSSVDSLALPKVNDGICFVVSSGFVELLLAPNLKRLSVLPTELFSVLSAVDTRPEIGTDLSFDEESSEGFENKVGNSFLLSSFELFVAPKEKDGTTGSGLEVLDEAPPNENFGVSEGFAAIGARMRMALEQQQLMLMLQSWTQLLCLPKYPTLFFSLGALQYHHYHYHHHHAWILGQGLPYWRLH